LKFESTSRFDADFKRLTEADRRTFIEAAQTFSRACDTWLTSRGSARWPASLRVKPLRAAPGVWEMTWSFSGPDGRATWEWLILPSGEPIVRWRRIGDHTIFRTP
jgi:hypothetical protein